MIGSVGPGLPLAVLRAAGDYRGPLPWDVDRPFPRAARWLESKFPLWSASILEDWATGALDAYDRVVFSRGDDGAQRLYYYICELQRQGALDGPEPLIFDLAYTPRESSARRTEEGVAKLAGELGVSEGDLSDPVPTDNGGASDGLPVCLLLGTPPPDHRLHTAVREAGWHLDGATLRELWLAEPAAPATFAGIGAAIHQHAIGPRRFADRAKLAVARARACSARAAVVWLSEEDEAELWHLPATIAALEHAGLPVLALTRRDWAARDGAGAEMAAFLKGLDT